MLDHGESKGVLENIFCFIDYAKGFVCVDHNKLWKILKEKEIPDHLTCLLETCMHVKKQQLIGHGAPDWFKIGKGVCQDCMLPPCLFNISAEYIMGNAELDDSKWNQDLK